MRRREERRGRGQRDDERREREDEKRRAVQLFYCNNKRGDMFLFLPLPFSTQKKKVFDSISSQIVTIDQIVFITIPTMSGCLLPI
jgi:hypothetical protein